MSFSTVFIVSVYFGYIAAARSNLAETQQTEEALSNDNSAINHYNDNLPGEPQQDYPTYATIPRTAFSCEGKGNWKYYADIDTECQVFHICETEYSKISFLCPEGSVFNQRHLVCDWWYNVDCNDAIDLYTLSDDFNSQELSAQELEDRSGFDLNPASSGGNSNPDSSSHTEQQSTQDRNKLHRRKSNIRGS